MTSAEKEAGQRAKKWLAEPWVFFKEVLGADVDPGQKKILEYYANPKVDRIAALASTGTGKTFTEAGIILHFLTLWVDMENHPKGIATAIDGKNLEMNLWAELARMIGQSPFMKSMFKWQYEKVVHQKYPATWFFERRTWEKTGGAGHQQALGLAGHHAKYTLFIVDESSGVPKAVLQAAERTLSTKKKGDFAKILQAGNPTHTSGPLWDAAHSEKKLWNGGDGPVVMTGDPDDPNRSQRVNLEWAKQQIASYGRENAYVQVYVLGRFPDQSLNTLLSPMQVEEAMQRDAEPHTYNFQKMKINVDVAFEGEDRTVIFPRQGKKAFEPRILRVNPNSATMSRDLAGNIFDYCETLKGDLILIDTTGGYGYGVMDALVMMGKKPIGVKFSEMPLNPMFANKRAEMWWNMAEWVKNGGCLPNIEGLVEELTTPTYSLKNGKILIEPKEMIKKRLGKSPDIADALAVSFALPDSARDEFGGQKPIKVKTTIGVNMLGKYSTPQYT